jgi:hypothetical protein
MFEIFSFSWIYNFLFSLFFNVVDFPKLSFRNPLLMIEWDWRNFHNENKYIQPSPGDIFLKIQKGNKKEEMKEYFQNKYGEDTRIFEQC